ncbi:MAG: exonuclease SbcCD subunit D [Candidatus Aenigmatarchaeota archaeon]|nr:MAG: exonuclease SbcCD subunit D [Candidatus Aenigmarchaeota archaeon]
MRFAHFSDTHLGFRQYGLYEREMDFYRAFEKTIAKIAEERPDFVLHCGDLFDAPKPPPRALWVAQRSFAKLKETGIPVSAITGNHDMLFRRGSMPPQVLYKDMGVRMLTEEEPFLMHKDIFIGGVPYHSKHYSESLRESLRVLSSKASKHAKSIIMIHQATDRHMPKAFELEISEIPKNFSYYAMGHLHARITESFGKGKIVYPGPAELWSLNEYEDYKRKGRGFTLVDLDGNVPEVQHVNIEPERELIRETVNAGAAEAKIRQLREEFQKMRKKPLLYLDVKEGGFDKSGLHELITAKLSDHVLSFRVSYVTEQDRPDRARIERSFDLPQINEILKELLHDEKHAKLAGMLFRSLSAGNEEQASKEAESFYKSMGGGT